VKESVVSDSTCLIGLERIGELNILPALFDPMMIPPEVEREFGSAFSWLQTENLTSGALVAALRMVVDAGEAEAIALASEKNLSVNFRRQTGALRRKASGHRSYWNSRRFGASETKRRDFDSQADFRRP